MNKKLLNNKLSWNAKNFYTSTELNDFIEPLKSMLLGKSIDGIMVIGHIYTSCSDMIIKKIIVLNILMKINGL